MADVTQKMAIDRANKAALSFSNLFYETLDKRRHMLSNFYMDEATLVWNGNGVRGKDDVVRFYEKLPTSTTQLHSVDAQPLLDSAVNGQTTIHVHVSGQIRFQGKQHVTFFQSFLLTVQGVNWKVLSDVFRLQEII